MRGIELCMYLGYRFCVCTMTLYVHYTLECNQLMRMCELERMTSFTINIILYMTLCVHHLLSYAPLHSVSYTTCKEAKCQHMP